MRVSAKTLFVLVFCGVIFGLTAGIQAAPSAKAVNDARLKGLEHLKAEQRPDGSWEFKGHPVGITALCTIALIENGTPVSNPVVQKGYQFVVANTEDLTETYDMALAIILLSKIDARANRKTIYLLAGRLVAGQLTSGGWSYSCPKTAASVVSGSKRKVTLKPGEGDNSCTQFAVLGLWTASRSGAAIEDSMALVAERFARSQNEDGGWPYKTADASRDSMTFAGLFCLTVARATRLREELRQAESSGKDAGEKTDHGETLMSFPVFEKGLKQAGNYVKGVGTSSARYYLWSVERIGVMLGLKKIGETDWFDKGADALLKAQGEDGEWKDSRGTLADTAFATLFLRRANLGSDITRMLQGDPEKPFVIINQKGQPRFDELLAAMKASKPGDTIRVDSDGPLKMPHIECKHDLKIQAGFGYTPIFQYDRGDNKMGLPGSPLMDPETRYLAHITKGTLTLEGLKLEMEPPSYGRDIAWSGIRIEGGNLQMLNCTFTEGGRHGMAMIDVVSPTKSLIRNCVVGGGRAAIEIAATGNQQLELENCVLFSESGIAVVSPAKKGQPGAVSLKLGHTTFQAVNALNVSDGAVKLDINSEDCAYKTDTMVTSDSAIEASRHKFAGTKNVYDVTRWIRAPGSTLTESNDVASWTKFWGNKEKDAFKLWLGFQVTRRNKAYTHRVFGEDWSFSPDVNLPSSHASAGVYGSLAGSGMSFSNFRESVQYNSWLAAR